MKKTSKESERDSPPHSTTMHTHTYTKHHARIIIIIIQSLAAKKKTIKLVTKRDETPL